MSRKSHPIGLRLNYAQSWKYPVNLSAFNYFTQRDFFIWRWLVGFCRVNYYYLFDFVKIHESRVFAIFTCLFYNEFGRKNPRPRKLLLEKTKYFYRSKKSRMKRSKLFRQKFLRLYRLALFLKILTKKTFSKVVNPKNAKAHFLQHYAATALRTDIMSIPRKRLEPLSWLWAKRFLKRRKMRYTFPDLQATRFTLIRRFSRPIASRVRYSHLLLRTIQRRFYLLRLKTFLEFKLSNQLNKHTVFFLQNLYDGFLIRYRHKQVFPSYKNVSLDNRANIKKRGRPVYSFSENSKKYSLHISSRSDNWRVVGKQVFSIFKELKSQVSFYFPKQFIALAYLGCLFARPEVLLQWLLYTVRNVRKHSLIGTHQKVFDLFTDCLEHLVHLVGLLRGFRFEVRGKVNGSERTKKIVVVAGRTVARQRLNERFAYHLEHIPTYAGALGVRLWLKY